MLSARAEMLMVEAVEVIKEEVVVSASCDDG